MVTLIVEGFEVDLSEDISADITYSLADIRTPDKRQVNFSKTITINGTARNDSAFGYIFDADVSNPADNPSLPNIGVNYNPKKLAKAQMFNDGVQVFDGALRLWKVIQDKGVLYYEISLFGKLFDIFSAMGDAKLSDLDLSNLDHVITWANIQTNWSLPSVGYRYPLVDFGYNEQDVDGRPSAFKFGSIIPSVYHKVYVDKIFTSIGAQYFLNFSNLTEYNKLLVVPSIPKIAVRPDYINASLENSSDWYYNDGDLNIALDFDFVPVLDSVENIATGLNFNGGGNTIQFTGPVESSFQYKINLVAQRYLTTDFNNAVGININLYNNVGAYVETIAGGSVTATNTAEVQEMIIEIPRRLYSSGQQIGASLVLYEFTQAQIRPGGITRAVSPIDTSEYPIPSGYVYEMKNSIPAEIKQVDFIKDFIKIFNLFVTPDPIDPKIYTFTPQIDFYSRLKANAIDWSDKIDYDERIEITPINQLTAKEYLFTWKQDKDYWCTLYESNFKQIYGQLNAVSDTDVVSGQEKIESIFSPGVLVRFQNSQVICPAIYKIETVEGIETKKPDKFAPRLMLWGGLLPAGHNINLLDINNGIEYTITNYPYAGHLDNPITPTFDLNFGSTLTDLPTANDNTFLRYWFRSIFEAFNKDSKLIACSALLRPEDIESLDFAALYRVGNQYYRLNKVEGYNPFDLKTCKIEIIKIVTL